MHSTGVFYFGFGFSGFSRNVFAPFNNPSLGGLAGWFNEMIKLENLKFTLDELAVLDILRGIIDEGLGLEETTERICNEGINEVCEFRRSGGAAPGINIPVGNDGGIDVNIGITIGDANDDECRLHAAQCRLNRLNANISADYPDLASPLVIHNPFAGEAYIYGRGLVFVNANNPIFNGDDDLLQATILHERLHSEVALLEKRIFTFENSGAFDDHKLVRAFEKSYLDYLLKNGPGFARFREAFPEQVPGLPDLDIFRDKVRAEIKRNQ